MTVLAHRRCASPRVPRSVASGITHCETVRAESASFARDLVLVRVHAESALASPAVVGVDAVVVHRLRRGRSPVREVDTRRAVVLR